MNYEHVGAHMEWHDWEGKKEKTIRQSVQSMREGQKKMLPGYLAEYHFKN